jgi:dihydroorotase
MNTLRLNAADDWHCHLRDGEALLRTVDDTSRYFRRAIVMPNLNPPITQIEDALAYRARILSALPKERVFTPLMTLYLTDHTQVDIIDKAKQAGITACKLYPANATTNAHSGVSNMKNLYSVFDSMQRQSLPLLIHAESMHTNVDVLNREAHFLHHELAPLLKNFPHLAIVIEHISTAAAVEFIQSSKHPIAATITPHHLLLTLNDLMGDALKPHYFCKPIVKQNADRQALITAAISGSPKFFLGTDSAPHSIENKLSDCGCAGIYNAPVALPLYAHIFSELNAIDKLNNFASGFGADFYQLPRHREEITLVRDSWTVAERLDLGPGHVVPFWAGCSIPWRLHE